ncbi:MAG: lytic murein transglycosylase [Rhodobiaceae bacterium]|nr:lytic murein transglycosylase [Rhodobiaceae bacterium]
MRLARLPIAAFLIGLAAQTGAAGAQTCGGDFAAWLSAVVEEAKAEGVGEAGQKAIASAQFNPDVIKRDRAQGIFTRTFLDFSSRLISQNRLDVGRAKLNAHTSDFARAEATYGVPGAVIAAFWGLETDFGGYLGDFDTINSLATLAHDCRRPELFRPQLIAAGRLVDVGDLPRSEMKGAWAGEIGQTQFLPEDYLRYGIDDDGDGKVDLRHSEKDVIQSTANFLKGIGWRAGEPWLEEVRVPDELPWAEADLYIRHPRSQWAEWGVTSVDGSPVPADAVPVSLILPMGRKGPAFLGYENFDIYLKWNQSSVYTLTAAYFATRLAGAPKVSPGRGAPEFSADQLKDLQRRLQARGYDVGEVDGVIGASTRAAIKAEQIRLGLPADSYPSADLFAGL